MRTVLTLAGLSGLLCLAAGVAADETDLSARVTAHLALIAEHEKAGDPAALVMDVKTAVALFQEAAAEEKVQLELVKAVGGLSKSRDETLAIAAIGALGEMKHEEGAKYLKSHLRVFDEDVVDPVVTAAIEASGQIAADGAVAALIKMVEKSENYDVAAKAMRALGNFGRSRHRTKILEALVDTTKRVKPGGPPRRGGPPESPAGGAGSGEPPPMTNPNRGSTARWGVLAPVLPEALNQLTGQQFPSADDWFDLVDEHKRNLNDLFRNRD
jgi:hypothetical protein